MVLTGGTLITTESSAEAATYTDSRWGTNSLRFNVLAVSGRARTAIQDASINYTSVTDVDVAVSTSYSAWAAENRYFGNAQIQGRSYWKWRDGITYEAQCCLNNYWGENASTDALRVVWLHEMGHALGLDHVSNNREVMYENAASVYSRGIYALTVDARNGINYLY